MECEIKLAFWMKFKPSVVLEQKLTFQRGLALQSRVLVIGSREKEEEKEEEKNL